MNAGTVQGALTARLAERAFFPAETVSGPAVPPPVTDSGTFSAADTGEAASPPRLAEAIAADGDEEAFRAAGSTAGDSGSGTEPAAFLTGRTGFTGPAAFSAVFFAEIVPTPGGVEAFLLSD
jgi:hypothetical protein